LLTHFPERQIFSLCLSAAERGQRSAEIQFQPTFDHLMTAPRLDVWCSCHCRTVRRCGVEVRLKANLLSQVLISGYQNSASIRRLVGPLPECGLGILTTSLDARKGTARRERRNGVTK
jgi:hypothetical protein